MTTIYLEYLPDDLIITLNMDPWMIMDFIIGSRLLEKAQKYGLTFNFAFLERDPLRQTVKCSIELVGNEYWKTVWLLEYHPQYP